MIKIFCLKKIYKRTIILSIFFMTFFIIFTAYKKSYSFSNSFNQINTVFYPCFDDVFGYISPSNKDHLSYSQVLLFSEIPLLSVSDSANTLNSNTNESDNIENATTASSLEIPSPSQIQVIDNDVPNKYTNEYNGVQIKNSSDYELTYEMMDPSNLSINSKNIVIFHTHTCESYTQTEDYQYEESGNYRTINLERSVVKVGSVLCDFLKDYGFNVIHDSTYHDYPSYNGSYGRSMATVQSLLAKQQDVDIIIDLHRDAISDETYSPSILINGEVASQLMFVIGSDGSGLYHPNWTNNLKFAIKVQEKANELYPGLFKPIFLRNSRYNQHLGKGACIIEVGATGNTLEQSMCSMKYLSYILSEVFK